MVLTLVTFKFSCNSVLQLLHVHLY
jgi:hypothetical protein